MDQKTCELLPGNEKSELVPRDMKTVYLVRHGESEHNSFCGGTPEVDEDVHSLTNSCLLTPRMTLSYSIAVCLPSEENKLLDSLRK